jgi:hypothetical protein
MYNVFTTFGPQHQKLYGKNFVETFIRNWPEEVHLYVYYEKDAFVENERVHWLDYHTECPGQADFQYRNKHIEQDSFYKGATRFSYKAFAWIHHLEKRLDRYNIWLDADIITTKPIPYDWLKKVHKEDHAITALMRQKTYHAETGFVLFDNSMEHFNVFLEHYKDFYERDLLFKLPQWHDAYIFTVIAHDMVKEDDLKILNLSGDLNWHPFVTGILGEYMDHLKGERKKFGFSKERKRWT